MRDLCGAFVVPAFGERLGCRVDVRFDLGVPGDFEWMVECELAYGSCNGDALGDRDLDFVLDFEDTFDLKELGLAGSGEREEGDLDPACFRRVVGGVLCAPSSILSGISTSISESPSSSSS